eukprot:3847285-Alexandrium_andersonii.AAC.1
MTSHMRRIGHILEHSPNNLGQLFRGSRQARPGEYLTLPEGGPPADQGSGGAIGSDDAAAFPSWADNWDPDPADWPQDAWSGVCQANADSDMSVSETSSSATSSDNGEEP